MRVVAIQNILPPEGYGYGTICRDVMAELVRRGYDVILLAAGGSDRSIPVRADLEHVPAAWRRPRAGLRAERRNQQALRRVLNEGVDAALIWHMRGIGKGVLTVLHDAGIPVVYLVGDLWIAYERPGPPSLWGMWQRLDRSPTAQCFRRRGADLIAPRGVTLRAPPLAAEGEIAFASSWLLGRYRDIGLRPRRSHVIPNGIDLEGRDGGLRPPFGGRPLRVVFAGRVDDSKGADLAILAVAAVEQAHLTMLGDGEIAAMRGLAARLRAAARIDFRGLVAPEQVSLELRRADVLLMPGRIEEAFGLVYLEAMAAGAVVIGTARGGAGEICEHGMNAIVVPPEAEAIAAALRGLIDSPSMVSTLAEGGRRTARAHGLERMVDDIEPLLRRRGAATPE